MNRAVAKQAQNNGNLDDFTNNLQITTMNKNQSITNRSTNNQPLLIDPVDNSVCLSSDVRPTQALHSIRPAYPSKAMTAVHSASPSPLFSRSVS